MPSPAGNGVTVTFQGEGAGYQNVLGWYKIDANGNPTAPKLVWDNVTNQSEGGSLVAGQTSVTLQGLAPGEKFGFFVNAGSPEDLAQLLKRSLGLHRPAPASYQKRSRRRLSPALEPISNIRTGRPPQRRAASARPAANPGARPTSLV